MTMKINIGQHCGGNYQHIGTVTISDNLDVDIDAVANEAGGLADLVSMGDWDGPEVEWTGDEVYEVADD